MAATARGGFSAKNPMTERQGTEIRALYPFTRWEESAQHGLHQYTPEACAKFVTIFDQLLERLAELGPSAAESEKIEAFKEAITATNELNEEDESLIETGEREDLCELCNVIARTVGIDPEKYGAGEGPASEWRDW